MKTICLIFLLAGLVAAGCILKDDPKNAASFVSASNPRCASANPAAITMLDTPTTQVAMQTDIPAISGAYLENDWTEPDRRGLQYCLATSKSDYLSGDDVLVIGRIRNAGTQAAEIGAEICGRCIADGLTLTDQQGCELLRGPHEVIEHSHPVFWLDPGKEVSASLFNLCLFNVSSYWVQVLRRDGAYRLSWHGATASFFVRQRPEEVDRSVYLPASPRTTAEGLKVCLELDRSELWPGQEIHFRLVVNNPGLERRRVAWHGILHLMAYEHPTRRRLECIEEIRVEQLPTPEVILVPGASIVSSGRWRFERKESVYCLGDPMNWYVIPTPGEYLLSDLSQRAEALVRLSWEE